MSDRKRGSLSKCGRGERLAGSGRSVKPQKDRAKCQGVVPGNQNLDTDSSIVSLTSSTQSARENDNKAKQEPTKEAMKDSNSVLSTDLYPTRDTEAEKIIRAELKSARVAREDQSTDDSAMKPIIVSEENYMAYGKSVAGRLKVRTKSRLKDDRAPRASRERLPKGTTKSHRRSKPLKSTRGGRRHRSDAIDITPPKDSPAPNNEKTVTKKEIPKETGSSKDTVQPDKPEGAAPKGDKQVDAKKDLPIEAATKKPEAMQLDKCGKADNPAKCGKGLPTPVVGKESATCSATADSKSKTPVAILSPNESNRTNPRLPLCKSCDETSAHRLPDDKQGNCKRTKRSKRKEMVKQKIDRIKANMKRAEILSHPSGIKYCESSSSFSTSSRIEFSD